MSKELSPDTKFTLSIQTMIGAGAGIASLVGMWYMLQSDIQEARELPHPCPFIQKNIQVSRKAIIGRHRMSSISNR